jgi:DnaJ-class molecular chaperone
MSNYYLALGIDRDADLDKIKKAYRFFSVKYQPGLANREQEEAFLRIQEAYDTLPDPDKRRVYDRLLPESPGDIPVSFVSGAFWNEKNTKDRHIHRYSSVIDDFFAGFVSGFFEDDFSGNKDLFIELILTPQEARAGGDFPVEIPVIEECQSCAGRGYARRFICRACGGSGNVHGKRTFDLHVPAGITTGAEAKVSLGGIGLENVGLNVEVVVR